MHYWHYGVTYDYYKFEWGVFFSFLYMIGIVAFLRNAWRSRSSDIKYNWPSVVVCFSAVGFVIYLIFIAQV